MLLNLCGMLLRHVRLKEWLGVDEVVGKNIGATHDLTVLVNNHRDASLWVLRKVG